MILLPIFILFREQLIMILQDNLYWFIKPLRLNLYDQRPLLFAITFTATLFDDPYTKFTVPLVGGSIR